MLVLAVTLHNIPEGWLLGCWLDDWKLRDIARGALALSAWNSLFRTFLKAIISTALYSAGASETPCAFQSGEYLVWLRARYRCHSYDGTAGTTPAILPCTCSALQLERIAVVKAHSGDIRRAFA